MISKKKKKRSYGFHSPHLPMRKENEHETQLVDQKIQVDRAELHQKCQFTIHSEYIVPHKGISGQASLWQGNPLPELSTDINSVEKTALASQGEASKARPCKGWPNC